jgi:3-hydroxybutyryl-CoA dehydratase
VAGLTIDRLQVGMTAELAKTYDEWDIYTFAALTGDLNPAHVDQAFAEKTVFKGKIAHGMLTASLVSAVLGTKLPGTGSIYLSQDLKFVRAVRIGDTVTARVEVVELVKEKNLARLKTTGTNQNGELLLEGTALVMPPKITLTDNEREGERRLGPQGAGQERVRPAQPRKEGFLVGQRMTPDQVTILPHATLIEARALLEQRRIRHLPVVEGQKLLGIITDRDIRMASLPGPAGRPTSETETLLGLIKVRDVMSRGVITISPEASIGQAARLLVSRKFGGLPVVAGERLVGIITVTDVLEALAQIIGVA